MAFIIGHNYTASATLKPLHSYRQGQAANLLLIRDEKTSIAEEISIYCQATKIIVASGNFAVEKTSQEGKFTISATQVDPEENFTMIFNTPESCVLDYISLVVEYTDTYGFSTATREE